MKRTIIALTSALILAPTLVIAADNAQHIKFIGDNQTQAGVQFQGPVEVVKVQSLLDSSNPFMEKKVVVEGNLVRQLRKDTFIFSDGSNEIQVELDDDIHLNATLTPETKVRLFGEFENGRTPEIEVDHIELL
ncbi:YgiW/YdeI family stress tolerance OB fold protein [Vibrio cholerae]|nr:NirD/YgiW/YdeI family stress tolerance protein [Vibrio cholerae]EJL6488492.1 YgiW/YdeI family stress tolerance OB fold protein [Vibrio cholerae]EJL6585882.1 YgiW/YdeI family stress tolerance OB fold protein [Vibrio cholerae]EJL6635162.1 YgiW/YdeI family stress tolerance OB fold protein [Vibrio cholerae]EJL6890412.1 YgiW/YdeI family stress tolerance OB fold protein [Vibrio cholerae]